MNTTYARIELLRLFRNKRVMIFSTLLPAAMLLVIGGANRHQHVGDVTATAYIMASMAVYGAMTAAVGSGGSIAVERGLGWNRQLRLTPLRPGRYVVTKFLLALVMALPPVLLTLLVGALGLGVRLSASAWLLSAVGAWLSAVPFATLGIVVGYLAKPDSVQQVSALLYMTLAILGGLWVPIEAMPHVMRMIADYTPAYWAGRVARAPLAHGSLNLKAVVILLAWAAVLAVIALRRFRADTARA